MLGVKVDGGTGAGTRIVRQQSQDWECPSCKQTIKYYWLTCPLCGGRRGNPKT